MLVLVLVLGITPLPTIAGKYSIRALNLPDDALFMTKKEQERWGAALADDGLRAYIEGEFERCKAKEKNCSFISELVSITNVKGSSSLVRFSATWASGFCGVTGNCSYWVFNPKTKKVTAADGLDVKFERGRLMTQHRDYNRGPESSIWEQVQENK